MLRTVLLLACTLALAAPAVAADRFSVVHRFDSPGERGPNGRLLAGPDGALYGTSGGGGAGGASTVFRLAPPAAGSTQWQYRDIYTADPVVDGFILAPPAMDRAGALYISSFSGTGQFGTIFRLAPPAGGAGAWVKTVLHRFDGARGSNVAGLVLDSHNTIYGATRDGGQSNGGQIFRLRPPQAPAGAWTYTLLHALYHREGYAIPAPLLLRGTFDAPVLYGVATYGGSNDIGTVFRLTPPRPGGTSWQTTVLHEFAYDDGSYPEGALIADRASNLYGTTFLGGISNGGVAFRLAPPAPGKTAWTASTLSTFFQASPIGALFLDTDGRLTGAAYDSYGASCGCGAIFRLTPTDYGGNAPEWHRITLHEFDDPSTALPLGDLTPLTTPDGVRALYGTTRYTDSAVVFRLLP